MRLYYLESSVLKCEDNVRAQFDTSCDVLVIGVGAAGGYAAIAAAREGAKVIAIEREDHIGGMPVNGLVTFYYYGARGGTFESLDAASKNKKPIFLSGADGEEMRRIALIEQFDKYGVTLFCGCVFDGVYFDGDRVIGVSAFINGQRKNIATSIIIDATSDGHVIKMCPVATEQGRPSDGKTVPFSVRAKIQNGLDGCEYDNSDSGQGDPYNAYDFSAKIITAHGAKTKIIKNGKRLLSLATVCGIREGIRYEGEERLTYDDILAARSPKRVLFYAYSDLDKHGHDFAIDDELYQNWYVVSNLSTVTVTIPVPFGAVVPKGIKGLVSAGRCFSVDSYASSAVRMNRDMFRMGECVGVASALAVSNGCDFLGVDYDKYVETVRKYGCYDGETEKKFGFHFPGYNKPYTPIDPNMSEDDVISQLSLDRPGAAIWASYRNGSDSLAKKLISALDGDDELLKYNCAIALGIMGRKEGLNRLRELVDDRSDFYFKDCRRSNQFRSVIAICLLGRLGDESDIARLEEIIFNDAEFNNPIYDLAPDYLHCNLVGSKMILFQHFTHAVMAYIKLAKRVGLEIKSKFSERFVGSEREKIIRAITLEEPTSVIYGEISDFLDNAIKMAL